MIVFYFQVFVFEERKEKRLFYVDFILHRVNVWNETLNNLTWFCCRNLKKYFKMFLW